MHDDDRDKTLTALIPVMASLPAGAREWLATRMRSGFQHAEATKRRRKLLRRVHRIHYGDLSDLRAAECIADDLGNRTGTTIRSTGSASKDQVIDEIIMICPVMSVRTIRLDLSAG